MTDPSCSRNQSFAAEFWDVAMDITVPALGRQQLHVAIDLSRSFDRPALEQAATSLVAAFPILGCGYRRGWWRDSWVAFPQCKAADMVFIDDAENGVAEATAKVFRREIDPYAGWPWRIDRIARGKGCRLIVTVLHQLVDAAGALSVAREFAARLMSLPVSAEPAPMNRGLSQIVSGLRLADLPRLFVESLFEWTQPLLMIPFLTGSKPRRPAAKRNLSESALRTVALEIGPESKLGLLCRDIGCTVNDLLVALLAMLGRRIYRRGPVSSMFTIDMRRYLPDRAPRFANLSVVNALFLPRREFETLEQAVRAASRRINRRKRRFPGMPFLLGIVGWSVLLPHALVRLFARLLGSYAMAIANRSLTVTNIGRIDDYVAPLGDAVESASMIGPFIRALDVPLVTATGCKDTLTLQLCGAGGISQAELDAFAAFLLDASG